MNRGWKAPEIQTMYSLNLPAAAIRTKVRQEFERHRFVNQLPVVDSLIFRSHTEYQVRLGAPSLSIPQLADAAEVDAGFGFSTLYFVPGGYSRKIRISIEERTIQQVKARGWCSVFQESKRSERIFAQKLTLSANIRMF